MAIAVKLGPADHGRPLTLEEFLSSASREGWHYELIDGKLYVSPVPNLPEDRVEDWVYSKLKQYSREHPGVVNYVNNKTRVFVPVRPRVTAPEPDVAAYRGFPLELPFRAVRWQDVSPLFVVEVLSIEDPDKDLVRNVELYLQVPTIREYWLIDTREDPETPSMTVYRRHGSKWRLIPVAYGETYSTRLLPGFELILDPRS
jgi:Uma2 family endonuclease